MRGDNEQQAGMYSYISPEQRVPADHPLRPIRKMTDEIFKQLSPQFDKLYSRVGRPSIAPERLLRALLLQVLYSVRSERMLMEQLSYNMRAVVEVDVVGFFDHVQHDWVRQFLRHRVNDEGLLRLVGKWLAAGVMEHGVVTRTPDGVPQGGPVSPVLSNRRCGCCGISAPNG